MLGTLASWEGMRMLTVVLGVLGLHGLLGHHHGEERFADLSCEVSGA